MPLKKEGGEIDKQITKMHVMRITIEVHIKCHGNVHEKAELG